MIIQPLVSFDSITLGEINDCLVSWGHKMGPLNRPDYGSARYHGLRYDGLLVAVVAADQLIPPATCGLSRDEAFELTRLCSPRPDLCRPTLRLWRSFVFPSLAASWKRPWAISYQDRHLHTGNLYRFDGWVRLGATRSGTDRRGGGEARQGRNKTVWGWHDDAQLRRERKIAA